MEGAALAISIIALVITGVGWFVASWLNTRTQKQALINSLTNDARCTLTDAIREFQDWCVEIQTAATSMPMDDIVSHGKTGVHHEIRRRELERLSTDPRQTTWVKRLEEYEPLFPGTARVRIELLHMVGGASATAQELADQHEPGAPPSKDDLDAFGARVYDLLALTWDLLVYVQNYSIGRITGNRIPEREPEDPTSIKLVADSGGSLRVVRPKQPGANKGRS